MAACDPEVLFHSEVRERETSLVLGMSCACRHPAIAFAIASANFPDQRFLFRVSQSQAAVRSGLVRKEDVRFPLEWYVEKRLCRHKKLLLAYMAENSTIESKQFFESLDTWQQCSE